MRIRSRSACEEAGVPFGILSRNTPSLPAEVLACVGAERACMVSAPVPDAAPPDVESHRTSAASSRPEVCPDGPVTPQLRSPQQLSSCAWSWAFPSQPRPLPRSAFAPEPLSPTTRRSSTMWVASSASERGSPRRSARRRPSDLAMLSATTCSKTRRGVRRVFTGPAAICKCFNPRQQDRCAMRWGASTPPLYRGQPRGRSPLRCPVGRNVHSLSQSLL